MVIFYDNVTKEIRYTENEVMLPILPKGTTAEQKATLAEQGINFVSVPYEMGTELFNYKLCFDTSGNFIGLQPK